ncbi:uncharacterized protein JCM6883_005863 [Sporobolomyces salmoneus]|uniref:uncharacterized protein n=1 Tax=Sporobolomyces salmoneus TaxID=183962 RepID=UPI00316DF8A0
MQTSVLSELPSELLLHLLSFLSLSSLLSLSRTNSSFHSLIQSSLLPRFALLRLNYSPATLAHLHYQSRWTWGRKASWAERIDEKWRRNEFTGVSFGSWERSMPLMRLWGVERGTEGVLIARGAGMEWWVARDLRGTMNRVEVVVRGLHEEQTGRNGVRRTKTNAMDDITALAEGARVGEIIVSRVSGIVQRLRVRYSGGGGGSIVLEEVARYTIPHSDLARPGSTAVQALASSPSSNLLVTASTTRLRPPNPRQVDFDENDSLAHALMKRSAPKTHSISIHSIVSPWEPPSTIPLSSKPWSVQLAPGSSSSPSWIAIGQSGTQPLSLVQLDSTGTPNLDTVRPLARTSKPTSVYSLTTPSIDCSPFLRPDETLIAAFFDSTTRIYDLRTPASSSSSLVRVSDWNDEGSNAGNEVMRLSDPWSDDPSYSVASGGPLGASIVVGSARNSAIRIFDIRKPTQPHDRQGGGITAFGPRGDRSPVYGLAIENSRIWAVTERKGFVFNYHADERDGMGEESIAFVRHEGEGKGELRKTGGREGRGKRVVEL